ncbi:MAG: RidA family protein [Gammaproteobacteria bacterium]|nr:RidA family protein [Gammaproteobacteria bacterium]
MMFISSVSAPLSADEVPSAEYLNSGEVFPPGIPLSEAVHLAPGGLEGETRQTMENIKTTLEAHGYSMDDVVKCLVMLADVSQWATFNDIYKTWFDEPYPARSAFGANGLAIGAQVEVECIAVRNQQ